MLKIRLQRIGRKHEPVFRLVLTDSKNSAKSGKFLEVLGNYDARRGEKAVFNEEKINYWVSKGAQVSDTVHNMLIDKKYIDGKKINKLPLKKAIITQNKAEVKIETPVESVPTEETPLVGVVPEATVTEEVSVSENSSPTEEIV